MTERRLNWIPRFDERSRGYPVRGAIAKLLPIVRRNKLWRVGPTLDQGWEGACVGFGWAAEAFSTPVTVDLNRVRADVPRDPEQFARFIYRSAQRIDEWEGEEYEGTSVLAGAKAMQQVGLLKEYRWAFSSDDVLYSVLRKGPVVIGIWWYESMYDAPNGILKAYGNLVGGHCLTVVGFLKAGASMKLADGQILKNTLDQDGFILQNSWGTEWGINGLAVISERDLKWLLADQGEACVASRRSYGRG
jgi:hypothetical protein